MSKGTTKPHVPTKALTAIFFDFAFSHQCVASEAVLPSSLQSLVLDGLCYSNLRFQVSEELRTLALGDDFNEALEGLRLPRKLWSLRLGHSFDQSLGELPAKLQCLNLGNSFTHSLDGLCLPCLQTLILGDRFNRPLTNIALPGLLHLTFGELFDQPLQAGGFCRLFLACSGELVVGRTKSSPKKSKHRHPRHLRFHVFRALPLAASISPFSCRTAYRALHLKHSTGSCHLSPPA